MKWTLLLGPVVGAIIGYFTNYIAVKMLFRPFKPVYIWGRRLPFTPGMIPKSKNRIAKAIGNAVAEKLLTPDAIEENLLSDEIKNGISEKVNHLVERERQSQRLIGEVTEDFIGREQLENFMAKSEAKVSLFITEKVVEMNVGQIVADQVLESIREKKKSSFFAKFLTEDFINSMVSPVAEKVNAVVITKGSRLIGSKIDEEFKNLQNKTVGEVVGLLDNSEMNYGVAVSKVYERVVRRKLVSVWETVDISGIIQDKMDKMEPQEVEDLILSIAKKELKAIINLGLLIGFILGCINLVVELL